MLAKIKFQDKDLDKAASTITQCLSVHPELVLAHLIKAQIELQKGASSRTKKCLEAALSIDLQIKHDPLYIFLKGQLSFQEVRVSFFNFLLKALDYSIISFLRWFPP